MRWGPRTDLVVLLDAFHAVFKDAGRTRFREEFARESVRDEGEQAGSGDDDDQTGPLGGDDACPLGDAELRPLPGRSVDASLAASRVGGRVGGRGIGREGERAEVGTARGRAGRGRGPPALEL